MKLTWANQITIVRILLIAPFVIFMLKAGGGVDGGRYYRYAALLIFIFMCVSDVVDGYLARKLNQTTRLGAFLDPMADKLLVTCACILLARSSTAVAGFTLPPTIVVLIIGKDLFLLLGFITVHLTTGSVHVVPRIAGKIGTFLQSLMVGSILIAPEMYSFFGGWSFIVRFLWWSAASAAVIATFVYIRQGICYIEMFEEAETNRQKAENKAQGTRHKA